MTTDSRHGLQLYNIYYTVMAQQLRAAGETVPGFEIAAKCAFRERNRCKTEDSMVEL